MKRHLFFSFFLLSIIATAQIPNPLDSLQNYLKTNPQGIKYIIAMRALAIEYADLGQYEKADSIAKDVMTFCQKSDDKKLLYYYYQIKGEIANIKSDGRMAISYLDKCKEIATNYNDTELLIVAFKDIAVAYRLIGDSNNQMKYALKVIEVMEKNTNIKPDYNPYVNVAIILSDLDEYEKALYYFGRAKEMAIKTDNKYGMAVVENRTGNVYYFSKNNKEAYKHYNAAWEIAKANNFKKMQGIIASNLGNIKMRLNENIEAEKYYKEAEAICRELNAQANLRDICNLLGEFYQKQKKYKLSEKYYLETVSLSDKMANPQLKKIAFEHLAKLYGETNDYQQAYRYAQETAILKDSVLNIRNFEQTQGLLAKYETEKKEQQIKLLNEEAKAANFQLNAFLIGGLLSVLLTVFIIFSLQNRNKLKRLEETQRLRNRIAADLHDEIGSTLSSISILSEMVAFQQKKNEFKPEIMVQVSNDARDVIDKMDDIIWTINPENDAFYNLETRLKSFAIPLFESKDIDFKFDFSPELETVKIDMGKRRDIYLILKEAINNLVKYSESKAAIIKGSINDNKLIMSIIDNGIGFDTKADSVRNGQKNMRNRAMKIEADLDIKSTIGDGTEVKLSIKV